MTFHRPKTGYQKNLGADGFLVDPLTGVIQTNQSYGRYSDGFFDVVIKASNSPDPAKSDFALMKIFVLQDTDLMKFVFDKNPVNVAKQMRQFKSEIEAAFAQVNIYTSFLQKGGEIKYISPLSPTHSMCMTMSSTAKLMEVWTLGEQAPAFR